MSIDEREVTFGRKKVILTHLNKVFWKTENITKGDLLDYYRNVANYILPYLNDRPLSLNRHPDGIEGTHFFQKDLSHQELPAWIKYTTIHSESNDKDIEYLLCNDVATLLWMVNMGCIEINPWLNTYKKIDNPLYAVLDLDPEDIAFAEVVKVALTVRDILKDMGVKPFLKTSGGRGLHIFIYTGGKYPYDMTKDFIHMVAQKVLLEHPNTTSLERHPSKRIGKIYLDYLQNNYGQTIAAPYSVRPKPGAPVSTPLGWKEATLKLNIKDYNIFNTLDRLKKKGDIWTDITDTKANIDTLLKINTAK